MKDKELLNKLSDIDYKSDIKAYLKDLVNLTISPFHDLDILDAIKLDKLEYDIIKYNLISKSIKALEGYNNITTTRKDNFKVKAILSETYDLINILFLRHICINVFDRTAIESIYNSTLLRISDLENKLNYYESDSDNKTIKELNHLIDKKDALSVILNDKEIISLDKKILDELEIPKDRGILVGTDNIYDTYEIYSNRKILVYKDLLHK